MNPPLAINALAGRMLTRCTIVNLPLQEVFFLDLQIKITLNLIQYFIINQYNRVFEI